MMRALPAVINIDCKTDTTTYTTASEGGILSEDKVVLCCRDACCEKFHILAREGSHLSVLAVSQ